MRKLRKKRHGLESRRAFYGRMFILVWEIGFVIFFMIPLLQSVIFSFSDVEVGSSGFSTAFVGLNNYYYAFYEQPTYTSELTYSITSFLYTMPFIVILSLIIAILLNQKFLGRTVMRSVFFLPVIVAGGVVMNFFSADALANSLRDVSSGSSAYTSGFGMSFVDFDTVLLSLGLPDAAIETISLYVNQIFNMLWSCGVQIVLFISGLQSIPSSLYEASSVEGATSWEEFWFITFPMLGNTLLLVTIYTTIDILTSAENKVMKLAYTYLTSQQNYSYSSAMLWAYFVIIGALVALVFYVLNHFLLRRFE